MDSTTVTIYAVVAIISYLIGAIPFGMITTRLKGVNIREIGSGNIGATNVGRALGKKFFFLVTALDLAKGLVPVLIAPWAVLEITGHLLPMSALAAGVAAVLGHIFPIYLKFKGGKGVATSTGVFLGLVPKAMIVAVIVWFLVLASTAYMSLASMLGALALTVAYIFIDPHSLGEALPITIACGALTLLIIIRHRTNISRLLKGEENKSPIFGGKKEKDNPEKEEADSE